MRLVRLNLILTKAFVTGRNLPDDFTSQRETPWELKGYKAISLNPFTPKSNLIDFTLSNARRFYSSKGDPLGVKGLNPTTETNLDQLCIQAYASPARSP